MEYQYSLIKKLVTLDKVRDDNQSLGFEKDEKTALLKDFTMKMSELSGV
jgi:hypothetical protein